MNIRLAIGCILSLAFVCLPAASASAELAPPSEHLPELGRCVKVAAGKGTFATASCTGGRVSGGTYVWVPGTIASGFKRTSTALSLRSSTGATIACTSASEQGEYTGLQTEQLALKMNGCEVPGYALPCSNAGAGEITTSGLIGTLGFVSGGTTPVVGLELVRPGSPFAEFVCSNGTLSERYVISGRIIARVTGIDTFSRSYRVVYKVRSGVQTPLSFEGGPEEMLSGGKLTGEFGLTSTLLTTNEERVEVKAIP